LALSIPKQTSELDDGLLTVSEVAQHKLNSDWVVLSSRERRRSLDQPIAGALALLVSRTGRGEAAAFGLAGSNPSAGV
jgi:hypothetical protein